MDNILQQFTAMTPTEQLELIKKLENNIGGEAKILSYIDKKSECYHCQSSNVIKFGYYAGKARYRCKDCKKTFSDFTGTSVYCIKKKHLWMSFLRLMLENKPIRYIAKQLHLSTKTVFLWRHRVLDAFQNIFQKKFKGIVETDDIYLPFNQKGRKNDFFGIRRKKMRNAKKRGISNQLVSVMVWADRYQTLDMQKVKLGRITKADLDRTTNLDRLNDNNIICSDTHRSIESFVKTLHLKHVQIKAGAKEYVKEGLYHIQKVNSLASQFKRWLNKNFISVSTKYLQNYLSWFKMTQILNETNTLENFISYSLQDIDTFYRAKNVENNYQQFLTL